MTRHSISKHNYNTRWSFTEPFISGSQKEKERSLSRQELILTSTSLSREKKKDKLKVMKK